MEANKAIAVMLKPKKTLLLSDILADNCTLKIYNVAVHPVKCRIKCNVEPVPYRISPIRGTIKSNSVLTV